MIDVVLPLVGTAVTVAVDGGGHVEGRLEGAYGGALHVSKGWEMVLIPWSRVITITGIPEPE